MEADTRRQSVARMSNDHAYNVLWGTAAEDGAFLCECSGPSCAAEIRLTSSQYVNLRDRGEFVCAPGHHAATPYAVSPTVS